MLTQIETTIRDYTLATGGSLANEAMWRSRIDAIMLGTLAMMERECVYNPRLSTGTDSVGRRIKYR